MRRWLDFVALKWMGFHVVFAVLLGNGLQSLLLFAFGWSMGYYVVLPMITAASTKPALAPAIGFIPPSVLRLIPVASGVVFGSLPWLSPFLPVLHRKPRQRQEYDPPTDGRGADPPAQLPAAPALLADAPDVAWDDAARRVLASLAAEAGGDDFVIEYRLKAIDHIGNENLRG
jgi:hypothetical protein